LGPTSSWGQISPLEVKLKTGPDFGAVFSQGLVILRKGKMLAFCLKMFQAKSY
jgi:hypothetical protein